MPQHKITKKTYIASLYTGVCLLNCTIYKLITFLFRKYLQCWYQMLFIVI